MIVQFWRTFFYSLLLLLDKSVGIPLRQPVEGLRRRPADLYE
jgi:hypothetical protein